MISTSYTLKKYDKLIKSEKNRFGQQPVKTGYSYKGRDLDSGRFCFEPELVKYVLRVKRDIFLLSVGYIYRE